MTSYGEGTPLIKSLRIDRCARLVFSRLEFQNLRRSRYNHQIASVYSSRFITIENCFVHSASSLYDYSRYEDWWNNLADGVVFRYGAHNVFKNNTIKFAMFALAFVNCDSSEIVGNEIAYFGGDGVRLVGSNDLLFAHNFVRDNLALMPNSPNPEHKDKYGDALATHQDLLQAYTYKDGLGAGVDTNYRIVISDNVFISVTDTNRPYRGTAQGLWLGDGFHKDYLIENNLILSMTYNGIGLEGALNCVVRSNDVLDPYSYMPAHPYSLPKERKTSVSPIWIILRRQKSIHGGGPSLNNQIYDNITERIVFYQEDFEGQFGEARNNLILSDESAYPKEFVAPLSNPFKKENFKLSAASSAIDAGAPTSSRDLDGVRRPQGKGYDIGCFERAAETAAENLKAQATDFAVFLSERYLVAIAKGAEPVKTVALYDLAGNAVFKTRSDASRAFSVVLPPLAKGVYFVSINGRSPTKAIIE